MKNKYLNFELSSIESEASAWHAQLMTGDLSRKDMDGFREWINRSPKHAAEIKAIAEMSNDLVDLVDLADSIQMVTEKEQRLQQQDSWLSMFTSLRVAVVIIALAVVGWGSLFVRDSYKTPQIYATTLGENSVIPLADGSVVELNTDSLIEVLYTRNKRRVRLVHGEAYFDIAKDTKRPFIVHAGKGYVHAVGTAFVVKLNKKGVEVAVEEGIVEFGRKTGPTALIEDNPTSGNLKKNPKKVSTATIRRITAGEIGILTSALQLEEVITVGEDELKRKLSWKNGMLDFSGQSLSEVVEEITRYIDIHIELDSDLKDIQFGGIFRISDIESIFNTLEQGFDVNVDWVDKKNVKLSRLQ
jgi:transmembrane sensor